MAVLRNISESSSLSDEELLQTFKQNHDQNVLAELYLRYYELVYGVALKYLPGAEAAKDAVMNIYTELLQKLPGQQIRSFKSWLYVFVRNHCLMQLRTDKKMPVDHEEPETFMQSGNFLHHDDENDKEAIFKLLEDCIKKLPEEQKQSIELFYLQSKSYQEVADKTGHEWNKVRSLIQNGRRNLKICMEKNNE